MDKYYTTARHLRDLHFQNMPSGNEMINASPFVSSDISYYIILYDAPSKIIINNRYMVRNMLAKFGKMPF